MPLGLQGIIRHFHCFRTLTSLLSNSAGDDAQRWIFSLLKWAKKIRAAHAKEKQQIQPRATTRIALT